MEWPMVPLPPNAPRLADGRFAVIGRLARGSITTLWRVWDEDAGDWRALHVVDANIATREDAQRFSHIADRLLALDHPNVIRPLDTGLLRGGVPFLVTELPSAGLLSRGLSRTRRMPPRSAGVCAIEIADALAALHQLGLVHREVAAEHVHFRDDGAMQLSGFDLCLTEGQVSRRLAGMGVYRAPEQIAAEADPSRGPTADRRTDVYAVGVLLWMLMRGEPPRQPQRVSQDPSLLDEVEPIYVPILERCLAHRMDERYQAVEELAEDLLAAVDQLPDEETPNLAIALEEQTITAHVPELSRVADSSTDQTPAWLEDRPLGADPPTHATGGSSGGGKTFGSSPRPVTAHDSGGGKRFELRSPSHQSGDPPTPRGAGTPRGGGTPTPRPARTPLAPPPPPDRPIGAPEPGASESSEPTPFERAAIPVAIGVGGASLFMLFVAVLFGFGMVGVQRGRDHTVAARESLLDLVDLQRPFVEKAVNAGAPVELERRYLTYTSERGEENRITAAIAFIDAVEELQRARGNMSETDPGSPTLVLRQLRAAQDNLSAAEDEWRDAASGGLGRVAVAIGLAAAPPAEIPSR
jgi:serine/threonine protein kinase